jgi:diadenosine tetraphosphate (Ap4A) HIT family hydrolase
MKKNDCILCAILLNEPDTPFEQVLPDLDPADQVIRRLQSASLTVDVAPVGVGHCLAIPNRHVLSMAQATPAELRDVITLTNLAVEAISAVSTGTVLIFEHGQCVSKEGDDGACSIEHAHVHALGTDEKAWDRITSALEFKEVNGLQGVQQIDRGSHGYLYIEIPGRQSAISFSETGGPQILRRLVSTDGASPMPLWNWQDMVALACSTGLAQALVENLKILRKHITDVDVQ